MRNQRLCSLLVTALVVACSPRAITPPEPTPDVLDAASAVDTALLDVADASIDVVTTDVPIAPIDANDASLPSDVALADRGSPPADEVAVTDTPSVPDSGPPDIGPPDVGALDAGTPDAGPPDSGPRDAGTPVDVPTIDIVDVSMACAPPTTRCGEACVNLATNPAHCGACSRSCTAPSNATPTCTAGTCSFSCQSGYSDCDDDRANGCETAGLCSAPEAGLLLHYPLDGNGRELVRGANATAQGSNLTATTDRFGRNGGALQLGTNQYLTTGALSVLPVGRSPRTMCLWLRSRASTSGWPYRSVAQWGSTNPVGARWGLSTMWTPGSPNIDRVIFTGQSADVESSFNVFDANWHFACVTYDGTTTAVWVDGEPRATGTPSLNTTATVLVIGKPPGSANSEYYGSFVDELRIWSRALSRAEIRTMWSLR